MSTRASILIAAGYEKQWFYRHSDGYPEGALPTLTTFMEWVRDGKIRNNVSQSCGWLVMLGAKEYDKVWTLEGYEDKESLTEPTGGSMGWKVGAYEPISGPTGDSEYIYTLNLTNLTIETKDVYAGTSTTVKM